jgi:23S rRNA (cytosine1962-C5)-methyltransferase
MGALCPLWDEYQLIDTGAGRKLERFGEFTLVRPEPQAVWRPAMAEERWNAADGEFAAAVRNREPKRIAAWSKLRAGEWKFAKAIPQRWAMRRENLKFWVQPAPSGHVGVFPDQACHWEWIATTIGAAASRAESPAALALEVLSLFGHTGVATLAAAAAGAQVTHVDASRAAVALARENQRLSGLEERPIRWIVEDALTFLRREARRERRYDAIILDPPRFGRGPKGEVWKLDESLPELLGASGKLVSDSPAFVLLNVYVTVRSRLQAAQDAAKLRSSLAAALEIRPAAMNSGQLALADVAGRQILTSVFARAEFPPKPA